MCRSNASVSSDLRSRARRAPPCRAASLELSADSLVPVAVPGKFRAVETGQGHTCAIRLDGALFCWGRNSENELGDVEGMQIRLPIRVGSDDDWLAVEAGQDHTCGLREDFSAHCWGYNTASETLEGAPLGIQGATLVTKPTRLETDADFTLLRTDTFHACAIARDRSLHCWGRNVEGQLGVGHRELRETPVLVGYRYRDVAVGRFTTCVIEDGAISCTGANDTGQLATGDTDEHERLTPVVFD
jgi:alpha-tubulin suppressor-like RCC1 family protein